MGPVATFSRDIRSIYSHNNNSSATTPRELRPRRHLQGDTVLTLGLCGCGGLIVSVPILTVGNEFSIKSSAVLIPILNVVIYNILWE